MTSQLELYKQVIMEHNKKPRNFGPIDPCTHASEGLNPLCGDHIKLSLEIDEQDGIIRNIGFEGHGCAISKASASMMTATVKGKSLEEATELFESFTKFLATETPESEIPKDLGKLKVFAGIWKYPSRVKCAALAWHALKGAMAKKGVVSTETEGGLSSSQVGT